MASFSLQFHYNSLHTTQHNAPYWLEWHCKPPHSRCRRPALSASERWTNPHHHPPLLSMTPLPLCSKSTASIQPKPILTPASSIKDRFVAGCDNKRYQAIGETIGDKQAQIQKNTETQSNRRGEKGNQRGGLSINEWRYVYLLYVNWQWASSYMLQPKLLERDKCWLNSTHRQPFWIINWLCR